MAVKHTHKRLKRRLKRIGRTQDDLAYAIGRDRQTVSRIINGHIKNSPAFPAMLDVIEQWEKAEEKRNRPPTILERD